MPTPGPQDVPAPVYPQGTRDVAGPLDTARKDQNNQLEAGGSDVPSTCHGSNRGKKAAPHSRVMGATVVVADDDETIRSILRHKLSAEGYGLHMCEDGEEARELLDGGTVEPDLVLLDVMMPGLEGTQLLRMIRRGELDVPADVPVIMLTSRGREADVLDGLESGADEYITKPFSPSEVLFRVKKHLGGS